MTTPRLPITPLPPGASFARLLKALPRGTEYAAAQFADTPVVANALSAMITRTTKSAVAGMTTGNQPDLAALGVVDAQTALLLAGQSAFEAARSRMREVPFDVMVPRQTDAGTAGGWIDEGHAAPVIKAGLFDTLKLQPVRLGGIFCLTDDILRRKGTERLVTNAGLGTQGRVETFNFLSPSVAASGRAPASITNGAVEVPWTGDAASVLGLMLAAITSQGTGLAWIGRPLDFALLAAKWFGGNATGLPASLLGIPVVPAPNAPAGLVVLADFAEIAYAATTIEVDVSDEATLEMSDTPTNSVASGSPEAPVATSMVNLFQTNSIAFMIQRFLNWSVVRDGAVAYTIVSGSPA